MEIIAFVILFIIVWAGWSWVAMLLVNFMREVGNLIDEFRFSKKQSEASE